MRNRSHLPQFALLATVGSLFVLGACSSSKSNNTVAAPSTAPVIETAPTQNIDMSAVKTYTVASRAHVTTPVTYPQTPPVGGDHNPAWQNCGIYDEVIPDERGVHSMEHGAVWITHKPDLDAKEMKIVEALAANQTYVLISPHDNLPSPIVASAWGKQLQVDSAEDPRLAVFVGVYQQGPQTPEPGAPCSGAIGEPR